MPKDALGYKRPLRSESASSHSTSARLSRQTPAPVFCELAWGERVVGCWPFETGGAEKIGKKTPPTYSRSHGKVPVPFHSVCVARRTVIKQ